MCDTAVALGAQFCSRCGVELGQPGSGPAAGSAPGRWYHSIWVVLFLMLFVLGPFALPMVWKNQRFSPRTKLALTAVALVYVAMMGVMVKSLLTSVTSSLDAFNSTLTF